MEHVKVYGKLTRKNEYTFRTSTYLQWGEGEESLGSFLLLNPGSSKSTKEQEIFNEIIPLTLDQTMRQVVKLIEKIYGSPELNGRVHIYNLFTLRNTSAADAIETYEKLANEGKIKPDEAIPPVEELSQHPWICCAWSVKPDNHYPHFRFIKDLWLLAIEEAKLNHFGKLYKNRRDYYHLNPRIGAKELLDELYDIYLKEIMEKRAPEEYINLRETCIFCIKESTKDPSRGVCSRCFYVFYDWSEFTGESSFSEIIGCPKCGVTNHVNQWDVANIVLDALGKPSVAIPPYVHERLNTGYYCPSCSVYISGKDLIRPLKMLKE